ncbi:hypothetical protein CCHR01_15186 [Colletotrichum chrysophilum]|uniref:Uncharacterized protein n=1 Tax=Colletotrichum chrysophilum TaxID=1836956 RepID=A0AAD9A6S3_9PEZI|nr:hypothetical protein CCHR01_15186 [Colletotrichum chrysophilum]
MGRRKRAVSLRYSAPAVIILHKIWPSAILSLVILSMPSDCEPLQLLQNLGHGVKTLVRMLQSRAMPCNGMNLDRRDPEKGPPQDVSWQCPETPQNQDPVLIGRDGAHVIPDGVKKVRCQTLHNWRTGPVKGKLVLMDGQ